MISRRTGVLALAAALVAVLVTGACSSSGSSAPANSPSARTGSRAPAHGTSVKVGVICSCSGPLGTNAAPAGKVAQAWAKSVNASGGIAGHPVDLIFKDDASTPGTSVTAAQSLIASHVSSIIDVSDFDATWAKPVAAAKIPVIGGNLVPELFYQDPDFYPSGQTSDSSAYADVLTAKQAGATNFGQLYCAEVPTCQQVVAPHKQAGRKLGVPVVYSASISSTAPNYTAQCVAAKQAHVGALFIADSPEVFSHVAQDCERQGYKPIYIQEGTAFIMQLAATPALDDHLWITFPTLPFFADKPAVQKMNAALDSYYPGLRKQADVFSQFAAEAWTGGLLIAKAIEAAGVAPSTEVTASEIVKGLTSLHGETLGGWSPPLTFPAGRTHSVRCWYTARVQNGKPVLANSGKLACEK